MKTFRQTALILLFLSVFFPFIAAADTPYGVHKLELFQDRLTLKADNAEVKELFWLLERKTGIEIKYFGKADRTVSADIRNCPLDKGLHLLMKNFNHSIIYESSVGGKELISTLFIYSKEKKELPLTYDPSAGQDQTEKLQEPANPPRFHESPGGVFVQSQFPAEADPLQSMKAIDPLARFDDGRPAFDMQLSSHEIHLLAFQQ